MRFLNTFSCLLRLRVAVALLLGFWLASIAPVRGAGEGNAAMEPYVSPTSGLGSWIWASKTFDGQTCRLWRLIEIPFGVSVTRARLLVTVDNEFTLFLDGRELGRGAEWRELFDFDLTPLMSPGTHVLAVRGYNSFSDAGMIMGLEIGFADGRSIKIKSDNSWRIVPEEVRNWEKRTEAQVGWPDATVVGTMGVGPRWSMPQNVNRMPALLPLKVYFWQSGWFQLLLLSVCGLVILLSLRLMGQLAFHRREQHLLREERARIARDIHDDIGARMTQLVLYGEIAQNELSGDPGTRQHLDWICEEARGLLSTMDEILWAVNPRRDTLRDFASYVCSYTQKFLKPTQIQCLFEIDPEMSSSVFDLPLRRSLLMAIKETLNNAAKHSKATELLLQIQWKGKQLIVVVKDNGKGFDATAIKQGRNGLTNMAQRMKELGGSCRVASQPGKGCRVEFCIPLVDLHRHPLAWIWNAKQFSEQVNETEKSRPKEPSQHHDPTKC